MKPFNPIFSAVRMLIFLMLYINILSISAQPHPSHSGHRGHRGHRQQVAIIPTHPSATIRYTTDGSQPTASSTYYTSPLTVSQTTILRAVEISSAGEISPIATVSYLFVNSILSQPNNPSGYPTEWGRYTDAQTTPIAAIVAIVALADMTGNSTLRPKIIDGLRQLPLLSIVSDKDNFFSHENDPDRGGIYIFTGPPVGDATGHGWTRPASVELIGGPQQHDLSTSCGIRLHRGHRGHSCPRTKTPKHSFRLVFKEQYGPKSLKYPLYGEDEPSKFDQLVLRCHFGNAWQHWSEGNREKAQYTRDVWARRINGLLLRNRMNNEQNERYEHLITKKRGHLTTYCCIIGGLPLHTPTTPMLLSLHWAWALYSHTSTV